MQQFKLVFELEHKELNREMDRLLVSFLKAAIQKYSPDDFNRLYNKKESIMKYYTFSYLLPGAKFQKEKILLEKNEFTMFFSDQNLKEQLLFFNAFKGMQFQKYPISHNFMKLKSIFLQKMKEIKETEIVIKFQSPLIVRKHNSEKNSDIYYLYNQEGFEKALRDNINFLLEKMNLPFSTKGFSMIPIKGKKVIVPIFGRNTDANIGIYKMTGSVELLNFLYQAGLGGRRSSGNGKFDVIG